MIQILNFQNSQPIPYPTDSAFLRFILHVKILKFSIELVLNFSKKINFKIEK
jgi:hypothetical protein